MSRTNNSCRPMRRVTGLFGVLLAFSVACNSGPTRPSDADVAGRYTGKWRGNINGFEVILDIRAGVGDLVGMNGTGTARNPETGEIHHLESLVSGRSMTLMGLPISAYGFRPRYRQGHPGTPGMRLPSGATKCPCPSGGRTARCPDRRTRRQTAMARTSWSNNACTASRTLASSSGIRTCP